MCFLCKKFIESAAVSTNDFLSRASKKGRRCKPLFAGNRVSTLPTKSILRNS